jgi:hypothetical protein
VSSRVNNIVAFPTSCAIHLIVSPLEGKAIGQSC